MAFIGEAALSAFFEALFGKFTSSKLGFVAEKQVHEEIMKWETLLRDIHAVLADAEEKQMKNQAVKVWLSDLRDLAYDVDDILDEFATEALERKLMKQHQASCTSEAKKLISTCYTSLHPSSIMFHSNMVSEIKKITGRLEDLKAQKITLQLTDNYVGRCMAIRNKSSQSALRNEADVFGRKEDKEKLLDLLVQNDHGTEAGFSVIPIVGIGGIGKTTLAQLVYHESKGHFDIHAWACVSVEFDIIKVTKTILQSVTPQPRDSNDLNWLQVKLKEELSGKKFLIVLDDVWNGSYEDWSKLQSPFVTGAPGSKIIVITRSYDISSIIKAVSDQFSVQKLTEDDSLSMLAHHALGAKDFSSHVELKEIGLGIVKKCDGLPLAIKTIGRLLRSQMNHKAYWKDILESEIWSLPDKEDNATIIPALQLSYYHLSSQLKQCFAYCFLVPEDYEFTEQEIVQLWMAEGFLEGATKMEIEDLGRRCFKELVSRSYFQVSSMRKSHFVMHDLINDLAQSIAGNVSSRTVGVKQMQFSRDIRHSSYIMGRADGIKRFKNYYEAKRLRTFLPFHTMVHQRYYLSNKIVTDLLPRLRCLRVLSLKWYYITKIPGSIGNLKHLRYLDFSYTGIRSLPNSICTLYNLETLLLRSCENLEKLPSKIGLLVNLCHLDIAGASLIKEMPSGIGGLTNLRTLSNFIVGQDDELIREMENLSNLKGQLCISELQNLNVAHHAEGAKLSSKADLDALKPQWTEHFNENFRRIRVEAEVVLRSLQPHKDLKVLTIKYYAGKLLPTWIGDPSFKILQSLNLEDCRHCTELPAVGKLPLLKVLYIKGMTSITSVGNEFYGENLPNVFPSLESLHFEDMPEWKKWKPCEVGKQSKAFCSLRELLIKNCPKLVGTLPNGLPSLEKLVVCYCQESIVSISELPRLSELVLHTCKEVVLGSSTDLWSVKKINLSNISKFVGVTEKMVMSESMKVEHLCIDGCVEPLLQTKFRWLGPLRSLRTLQFENFQQVVFIGATAKEEETKGRLQLEIPCNIEVVRAAYCETLEKLSETLSTLTCLRQLKIEECPKLVTFSVNNLPSTLRILEIQNCENLQCLLDDGRNIDFSSKSLLESLIVFECGGLKSVSSSGKLPRRLKLLDIRSCQELEVVASEFNEGEVLESIQLYQCPNIKSLPKGLDKLSHLQSITVRSCPNLIRFPENGLPTSPNLKSVILDTCGKLEDLPNLHSLQLQKLHIWRCPRLKPIRELRDLPPTLRSLTINEPDISKAVMQLDGVHRLASLAQLRIDGSNFSGSSPLSVSQVEMGMNVKLPSSLTLLDIQNFYTARKLSSTMFQNLSSLQSLSIFNCPKLKTLPKKEMLPSLLDLFIWNCPALAKRCKRGKGLWSDISHIPFAYIDGKFIYE